MKKNRPSDEMIIQGVKECGKIAKYARLIGQKRRIVSYWHKEALENVSKKECRKTFVLTSAQINTTAHERFMSNLNAICREKDANLLVSGFTYNKNGLGHDGMGDAKKKDEEHHYDTIIRPYMSNKRTVFNENIEFLGNMNTLPTAVNPLSGLKTYTKGSSAVLPHPKIVLESVATNPGKLAKIIMTTGCCTVPNYMQKKAGIKAEFHHQLGAVIIEVVDDKKFFYRHLLADDKGDFYDLTTKYEDGEATTGHRVDNIVFGDIHHIDRDEEAMIASFGDINHRNTSMLDILKPKEAIVHDVLDSRTRNHHNRNDTLFMHENNNMLVMDEVDRVISWLDKIRVQLVFMESSLTVVASNHDVAYDRWIKECSHHDEPNFSNAMFLLQSQLAMYKEVEKGKVHGKDFTMLPVMYEYLRYFDTIFPGKVNFLKPDESHKSQNGVELGMHGDKGINGSRGSLKSFAQIGTKCTVGHSHSCGIFEGVYQVGCLRELNAPYSSGPSSWSHTNCIEYPNGKRTLVTIIDGQWCRDLPEPVEIK